MKSKVLFSLAMTFFFALATTMAQGDFPANCPRNPDPERVKYFNDNILPLLKMQRKELDKELSNKEKERITAIRDELKTLHQENFNKRQEFRENNEKPSLEQRQEMRKNREKMEELMEEAEIMADNHDATISRLLDEFREQTARWNDDPDNLDRPACPYGYHGGNVRKGKGMCGHGFGPGPGPNGCQGRGPGMVNGLGFHRILTPQGFLLWNPDEPLPFEENDGIPAAKSEINLFPNPARQNVQLSFMLENDATVAISIIDNDGNPLKELKPIQATKGLFSMTIDLDGLKNGLYFIRLKAGEVSAIGRLIVQN